MKLESKKIASFTRHYYYKLKILLADFAGIVINKSMIKHNIFSELEKHLKIVEKIQSNTQKKTIYISYKIHINEIS